MRVTPSSIIWLVAWVLAAFGLYMVKFKVQAVRGEVAAAELRLKAETRDLHVLEAEWTYLTRPERLRRLAGKYLAAKPVRVQQMADFASIPYADADLARTAASASRLRPEVTLAAGPGHAQ